MSGSESENDGAKQFLESKSTTKDAEADSIKQERLDILSSSYSRSVLYLAVLFDVDVELY